MSSLNLPAVLQNLTWLDFDPRRNCTTSGRLFAQFYSKNGVVELSTQYLFDFVRTCSPVPLRGVTPGQIVDFNSKNIRVDDITLVDLNIKYPVHEVCHREYCQSAKWEGNPDLSGIGVLTAYIFQTVVTTILCLFCLFMDIRRFRARKAAGDADPHPVNVHWLNGGCVTPRMKKFGAFLEAFWFSSFYFGLGMIIAGVAIGVFEGTDHTTTFAFLGVQLSTTVLACLRQWYCPKHRHSANACLLLMGILLLAIVIISRSKDELWPNTFELHCFFGLPSRQKARYFVILPLVAVPMILFLVVARYVWRRCRPQSTRLHVFKTILTIWSFIIMWISLGFIIQLRSEISDIVGDSYAENKWGFGQMLAVLAWLPLVVEGLKIWLWDSIKSTLLPRVTAILQLDSRQAYLGVKDHEIDTTT